MTWDYPLFLALNFDGGPAMDRAMLALSGTAMWLPLYALIVWLVSRRYGWRGAAIFLAVMLAALVLSDAVAGIFKHNGLLGDLMPGLEPRWRPMFTPELEGLAIAPDSLYALRQAGAPGPWRVHVPVEAVAGYYGTVSAHAATVVALAVLSWAARPRPRVTCQKVGAARAGGVKRINKPKHKAASTSPSTFRWICCWAQRWAARWAGPHGACSGG